MVHAKTVRLAEKLHKDALRYTQIEGISLNALLAVALREFLDRRHAAAAGRSVVVVEGPATVRGGAAPMALGAAIAKRVQGGAGRKKRKGW